MINKIEKKLFNEYKDKGYPVYIIGDREIKNHIYNLWKLLSRKRGIIISYQYPRQEVVDTIVTGWISLGLKMKGTGEIKATNDRNGEELDTLFIILEKIPKLWY